MHPTPPNERTVHLYRVLRTRPDKLWRAFLEPDALARWMPPHGFTGHVDHLDARVGGLFRMRFRNFGTGAEHGFGGEYLELDLHRRLRYTDRFDDPNLPGTLVVTVTFTPVAVGTALAIEQRGIPEAIPLEACHLGWQESLAQLATLVEPEIP